MSDLRDTVPAPPVPSVNPTAEIREELEAQLREQRVAIEEVRDVWYGLIIGASQKGVAERATCGTTAKAARRWLEAAQRSMRNQAWVATICPRCDSLRTTPSLCSNCLRGNGA